jgi:hypothetical protein
MKFEGGCDRDDDMAEEKLCRLKRHGGYLSYIAPRLSIFGKGRWCHSHRSLHNGMHYN